MRRSGSLDDDDDGLVVFLNYLDLQDVTGVLDPATEVIREGSVSGVDSGTVVSVSASRLVFSNDSEVGDSGGAYLLRHDERDYVIGTHFGNVGGNGVGTHFSYSEWQQINALLEAAQTGNVTESEPTNLVVGTTGTDIITGSYRPDILLGRDGFDSISDGDAPGDTVWADDILVGGAGGDIFFAGRGNDTIWGGDEGQALDEEGEGEDQVSYDTFGALPVTISYDGTGETPLLTVSSSEIDTDTLHSIERLVATSGADYFYYAGNISADYRLTIDFRGGGNDLTNGGNAAAGLQLTIGTDGAGTLTDTDSEGVIHLINLHTQIIGSAYDDEITDLAVHDGLKRIDGGEGDDVIIVDGSDSMIKGGLGDDEINGGYGNDILYGGEGTDVVHGGAGSDYLENYRPAGLPAEYGYGEDDELYGGDGHDYLRVVENSGSVTLSGGTGNDVIDARGATEVSVAFGAGDGHDIILAEGWQGPDPTLETVGLFFLQTGVHEIGFVDLALADVTIRWDVRITDQEDTQFDVNGGVFRRDYCGIGDLAIVVNSTGASIFIRNFAGSFHTFVNHDVFVDPTGFDHFELPTLRFIDGQFGLDDGGANIEIVRAGVAQYDVALTDYQGAIAPDPGDTEGTGGDDDLPGSRGDDAMDGGDGDDNFQSSGGNDTIDGGSGNDRLALFGALGDFIITRDVETGDVTIKDKSGLEGAITIKNVEKIYFATDNEEYEPGDLVGFWGTPGDDAIVQGNWRDNLIHGLAGADLLRGLDGDDLLDGGTGADTLEGGKGDDVYLVDDDGDMVIETAGAGTDEVRTVLASYTLAANLERLTGLSASGQTLTGNSLANLLTGGAGADTLNGGFGSDTVSWAWSEAGLAVDLQSGATSGDAAGDVFLSIENLTGGGGADALSGTSGANHLDGGGGADLLTGRGGSDIYYVDDEGDQVIELAGQGNDEVRTTLISYAVVSNVETLRYVGTGDFAGFGDDASNIIHGGAGDDFLSGGAGYDTLIGGDGADELYGDDDGDVLDGRGGADYMEGGLGNDNYTVDDEGDVVQEYQDEGIDLVYATLAVYSLTENVENLTGNSSDGQELTGNDLANLIWAAGGGDLVAGGGGNDELRGNGGDDVIDGGDGDDLVVGNSGSDELTGGAGADTFRFGNFESESNGFADRITDFESGTDKIDLTAMDADIWTAGVQDFTFIGTAAFSGTAGELRYEFDGVNTIIQGDWFGDGYAGLEIVLAGNVTVSASDFIF